MKILHFIYDHINNPWVGGGGAVRAYEIYKRLAERHAITVVSGKYPTASDYAEGDLNFHFIGTDSAQYVFSTFCYAVQAMRYLRGAALDYDVIIEDFAPYNPIFSFFREKHGILQLHQKEGLHHIKKYLFLGLPFMLLEAYYHRFFKNIVVISEQSRTKYGVTGNVKVIPNGFSPESTNEECSEGNYMLFLGRLHIHQKGLDILQKAFEHTIGRETLIIAGSGKDHLRTAQLFRKQIKTGTVQLTGFVTGHRKTDLLNNCKIFLLPSRYEGQPLTLIEAAACGKPVIVSDIPELKYAVDAGFGISFKAGNPDDLALKTRFLLENDSLRKEMGRKARDYAKNYTWDKIAVDYEQFLLKVTANGQR